MKKPALVVLAAGMGSRYGGLKQIDPLGPNGELILDYSLFDARRAGFEQVVFVIKPELEQTFRQVIGDRAARSMEVCYAFQTLDRVPAGVSIPQGRSKPWGTGHAVLCAKDQLAGPFGVINADDFYGRGCYEQLFQQLSRSPEGLCMVGFPLENTLSDTGAVSRGICAVSEGMLRSVEEHTEIARGADGRIFGRDGLGRQVELPAQCVASMNVFGLPLRALEPMEREFGRFLRQEGGDPLKREYYLPAFVNARIEEDGAQVSVLTAPDSWYGVTHREDRDQVAQALAELHRAGVYPNLRG